MAEKNQQVSGASAGQAGNVSKLPSPLGGIEQIMLKIGVKIAGKVFWSDIDLTQAQAAQLAPQTSSPAPNLPKPLSAPAASPTQRPNLPKNSGKGPGQRDPSKFLFTFGKFFKANGSKPIAIGQLMERDLFDWMESCKEITDPTPQLEVALEMVDRYLLDVQFVPPAKYKSPRSRA